MKQIHVLHILNSAHGGSALSTFELIAALQDHGIKSSLVCFNNAAPEQEIRMRELVEGRVLFIPLYWMNKRIRVAWWKRPVLEVLNVWKTWGGYRFQQKIDQLIHSGGVNLIHTSTILNPEGAIAAKRNKLPHVWHVRELIGPGMYFQFPWMRFWVSYVNKHAALLVANSSITQQYLVRYFNVQKIRTIPNGINVNSFTVKAHHSTKKVIVAMLGNVTSRLKNHEFFIRTASLLQHNAIEWRVYGTLPDPRDPYYSSLLTMINSGSLKASVKFLDHKKSPEIIREIDVLFHPTAYESFGRIFIEAMAGGIPVVAINQGGALEMVRDGVNGFLVPIDDVEQAGARIKQLVDSPELRNRMGQQGRLLVERQYTLERLAIKMKALYTEVKLM